MAANRGRLASIPPDHDVLGHPELRDKQGPPDGETSFRQPPTATLGVDMTKAIPRPRGGASKFGPGV